MGDTPAAEPVSDEQVVTPWVAKAGKGDATIDYDKLISKYMVHSLRTQHVIPPLVGFTS